MAKKTKTPNKEKQTIQPRDRARSIIITLVAALVVLLGGFWLLSGEKPTFESENITESQGVTIQLPDQVKTENYSLYIDTQRFLLDGTKEEITKDLAPGKYRIILTAPNYWPWSKTVNITEGEILTLDPFLIGEGLSSRVYRVLKEPKVYRALNAKLKAENQSTTAVSEDDSVTLSFEGSTITATYTGTSTPPLFFCENVDVKKPCPKTKVVYQGLPVLDAAFYNGRNDVYVLGLPGGVYVTEITARSPQNLHPVYHGELNAMAIFDGNVYLQDKGASGIIIEIPLFHTPTPQTS